MKINVYVLHGTWNTPDEDGSVIAGVSATPAPLMEKLKVIADSKGKKYVEMCGYIQEKKSEHSYEAWNGCGKRIKFSITEHKMEIPEDLMGDIGREMERIDRLSDVQAYLQMLYESENIEPWKYEYMTRNQKVMDAILADFDKYEDCNTPFNTTMEFVVGNAMNQVILDKDVLEYLWKEFDDVMVDDDGHIMDGFLGFKFGDLQKDVWRWFDETYPGGLAKLMYPDFVSPNTRISYLYRDGCNFKQPNWVIVPGMFSMKQIDTILDCLAGGDFIPNQVSFPEVRFGTITQDDTCWFEMDQYSFSVTNEKPDINMTPDEVVAQFLAAKDNWDDTAFEELLADACDDESE